MKDLAKDSAHILESLQSAIAELCERESVVAVAIEVRGSKERRIIEIYLDKPGDGISLDECAAFSENISAIIDERGIIPAAYRLDVSSPGVERPLVYAWQYARNIGRLVVAELHDGSVVKGRIGSVEGETVMVRRSSPEKKKTRSPERADASRAIDAETNAPIALPLSAIKRGVIQLEF